MTDIANQLAVVRGQIDANRLRQKEAVEEPGPWRP